MANDQRSCVTAYLGLGSNIGNKSGNVTDAIRRLGEADGIDVTAVSRFYKSEPWGVEDQDWFVNAVAAIETTRDPHDLLRLCQQVEQDMGRVRLKKWGPRIIDVDVLIYGEDNIATETLIVPHPYIAERAFVVLPLYELAPDLVIDGRPLSAMKDNVQSSDLTILSGRG